MPNHLEVPNQVWTTNFILEELPNHFGGAKSNLDEMVGPLRVGKGRVGKQQSIRKTEAKQVELRTILYWDCCRKLTNRSKATEEGGNEFVMLNHRGEGENPPPNVMTINC